MIENYEIRIARVFFFFLIIYCNINSKVFCMISNIKKLIFQGLIINNTNNYNKLSLKTIYL